MNFLIPLIKHPLDMTHNGVLNTKEDQLNIKSSLPVFPQIKKQTKILVTYYHNQRENIFPISPTIFCK